MSPGFWEHLKLDRWYKALVYAGGFIMFMSLVFDTKAMSNGMAFLFGTGALCIGVGAWKMEVIEIENRYGVQKSRSYSNTNDSIGVSLVFIGILLIVIFIFLSLWNF